MDEQSGQRVAADGGDAGGDTKCAGAHNIVRRGGEEEVGSELSIHVVVRICVCVCVLGDVGLQIVVWGQACSVLGEASVVTGRGVSVQAGLPGDVPKRNHGVFPGSVCLHHFDIDRRGCAGAHELLCVDAVRAAVAHILLHIHCIQHMEPSRVPGQDGPH